MVILRVEVRNTSCMQWFVSLVRFWEVITYLRGCLIRSAGVFECGRCSFIYLYIILLYQVAVSNISSCVVGPGSKQRYQPPLVLPVD